MQKKIWIRREISTFQKFIFGAIGISIILIIWFILTTASTPEKRLISRNVLPNPVEIIKTFPSLIKGTQTPGNFEWKKSLFYAIWLSLSRELIAFVIVIIIAMPLGIFMSVNNKIRSLFMPSIIIGTFIPIAALIPLTQAIFGIGELQKVIFLALGMFFVLVGLVMKEMDEVDDIYLHTAYTLGYSQLQTVFLVILPIALPRIWKHLSAIFGLGWGYIIFAEMINTAGGESVNGIGWLFIARQRRFQIADMYAIFFIIIFFAFLFSYLFKLVGYLIFKHERDNV
ncbi:MAG TPA: ABC transporter permease subunit [Spirochaetota bacterium]|nr:ABC transporter permease subunit [Spirochaetota bacterium]HOL57684.1 ABC transporter permease subunit [Spirochaetota bacterium]HPP04552.1 ABC transporter permease subunit [Spirochaetota bacterium]